MAISLSYRFQAMAPAQAMEPVEKTAPPPMVSKKVRSARRLPQLDAPLQSMTHLNDECLDTIYQATVEAVDESIINAMLAAEDTPTFKPQGQLCQAINPEELVKLLRKAGKCR